MIPVLVPALLALLSAVPPTLSQNPPALHEQDLIYYGAWTDPTLGDSPYRYNTRLGLNASVFQIAQTMPLPAYNYTSGSGGPAPEYLIENTSTNAAVMLTVYPQTLAGLTDNDYTVLGNQALAYKTNYNRSVFIRWGPEMQGIWNPGYGQQPTAYVATWKNMYTAVKTIAPDAAIVWAPNLGNGYPYGQAAPTNPADMAALDTNHDGQFNQQDNPFEPYYPGDQYVDWIGLSVYYKQSGQNTNQAQNGGYCAGVYDAKTLYDGTPNPYPSWYDRFCTIPGKACMIAESGAAWHPTDNSGTASPLQIQQAWWQDCITNTTNMDNYNRIKLHMHFEFAKNETDGGTLDLRDYRLTNQTDMLASYKSDLLQVQNRYAWATYVPIPSGVPSSGPGISAPTSVRGGGAPGSTATGPTLVMQTRRDPLITAPPTLFGITK